MPHVPDCRCPACNRRKTQLLMEHWLVAVIIGLALYMGGRAAAHFFG